MIHEQLRCTQKRRATAERPPKNLGSLRSNFDSQRQREREKHKHHLVNYREARGETLTFSVLIFIGAENPRFLYYTAYIHLQCLPFAHLHTRTEYNPSSSKKNYFIIHIIIMMTLQKFRPLITSRPTASNISSVRTNRDHIYHTNKNRRPHQTLTHRHRHTFRESKKSRFVVSASHQNGRWIQNRKKMGGTLRHISICLSNNTSRVRYTYFFCFF
jgi:hypothetical protein